MPFEEMSDTMSMLQIFDSAWWSLIDVVETLRHKDPDQGPVAAGPLSKLP